MFSYILLGGCITLWTMLCYFICNTVYCDSKLSPYSTGHIPGYFMLHFNLKSMIGGVA